jgi:hypothetical protein
LKRNPPRFQRSGSSVSQVFNSAGKKIPCVFNKFCTAPIFREIVTADETWMHHYEPQSKAQSMARKRPTSPVAKKFKSQQSARKIMLTFFRDIDMEGAILAHFTPRGETVNSQNCCDVLRTKPMPAI